MPLLGNIIGEIYYIHGIVNGNDVVALTLGTTT
jgi:hypothetical protein